MDMSKGLKARVIAIWVGTVVIAVVLQVTDVPPDTADSMILLYVFIAAIYFAFFFVKHEDEIPPRSDQR